MSKLLEGSLLLLVMKLPETMKIELMLIKKFLYLQALGLRRHILYGRFVKLEEEELPV